MQDPLDPQQAREHLWKIVRDLRFGMLVTRSAGGSLRARPLTTQNEKDDMGSSLLFFVPVAGEVATDVAADPRVGLVYADPSDDRYVSISGQARVVQDLARQKQLWSKMAEAWFPGGPDDPTLRLLEVHMDAAEYWDVKSSKMVQLFKMAKAVVTGKPPTDMGEHAEVR